VDLGWVVLTAERHCMSSPASSATWLPLAVARAAVVDAPPAQRIPAVGRHAAPEAPGRVEIVAAERLRPGRHAEGEWSREAFDPQRDDDALEWLGFTA
jgi:hypothetical protein